MFWFSRIDQYRRVLEAVNMQQQLVETTYQQHFEPLVTAEEAAVHLRCHLKTVQKMAREGRMPSIRYGKRHLFRLSDLDRWLQSMQYMTTTTIQ
jgi:excisionase family DNA binding protein